MVQSIWYKACRGMLVQQTSVARWCGYGGERREGEGGRKTYTCLAWPGVCKHQHRGDRLGVLLVQICVGGSENVGGGW